MGLYDELEQTEQLTVQTTFPWIFHISELLSVRERHKASVDPVRTVVSLPHNGAELSGMVQKE